MDHSDPATSHCAAQGLSLVDAHRCIDTNLECVGCGYNLRGLPAEGPCPECGNPVAQSLRPDLLRFADSWWTARLAAGARAGAMGVLGLVACPVLLALSFGWSWRSGTEYLLLALMGVPAAAVALATVGLWGLTRPEPTGSAAPPARVAIARRVARVAAAVFALVLPLLLAGRLSDSVLVVGILVGLAAAFAGWIAQLAVLRHLAERVPAPRLAGCFRVVQALVVLGLALAAAYMLWTLATRFWLAHSSAFPAGGYRGAPAYPRHVGRDMVLTVASPLGALGIGSMLLGTWYAMLLSRLGRRLSRIARTDGPRWTDRPDTQVFDAQGLVAADIACATCGYNLRGLTRGTVCPECGQAIGPSVQRRMRWMDQVSRIGDVIGGLTWLSGGLGADLALRIASGAFFLLLWNVRMGMLPGLRLLAGLEWLAALAAVAGAWRATPRIAGQRFLPERWWGWSARILLIAWLLTGLAGTGLLAYMLSAMPIALLGRAAGVVGSICLLGYLRELAQRISQEELIKPLGLAMWIVAAAGLAWLAVWMWPLIDGLLRALMLGRPLQMAGMGRRIGFRPDGLGQMALLIAWQGCMLVTVLRVRRALVRQARGPQT
jgi:predicted RNA-binding Zn-ribbon protein involved in translation (DUF1610 family)